MSRHPASRAERIASWRRFKAEQAKRRQPAEAQPRYRKPQETPAR